MKSIDNGAFNACSSLTDVFCLAENVPGTNRSAFSKCPIATATLHVPEGSLEKYQKSSPWSGFGSIVAISPDPVTYVKDQMATIILPTVPDASKGKFYRMDRYEDGKIIFGLELQPQARTPYIIVPSEDFSIDLGTLDLEGLTQDVVSIEGISFIGSYQGKELECPDGCYIDIIDTTPDCTPIIGEGQGERLFIGALRAYLIVTWDDPISQGGTKVPPSEKLPIVLLDDADGINSLTPDQSSRRGEIFDLQGRRLSGKPERGIYIEGGKKVIH